MSTLCGTFLLIDHAADYRYATAGGNARQRRRQVRIWKLKHGATVRQHHGAWPAWGVQAFTIPR